MADQLLNALTKRRPIAEISDEARDALTARSPEWLAAHRATSADIAAGVEIAVWPTTGGPAKGLPIDDVVLAPAMMSATMRDAFVAMLMGDNIVTLYLRGDYVAAGAAVANDVAIAAALAKIATMAPTLDRRATLLIRAIDGPTAGSNAGKMAFATPFAVPKFVDFFQANGTTLVYAGTNYSKASITIGETTTTASDSRLVISGLRVDCYNRYGHRWWRDVDGGGVSEAYFAGVRVGNSKGARIQMHGAFGYWSGLQLYPAPGGSVGHAHIEIGSDWSVNKCMIDFRGSASTGWVNENKIYGPGDTAPSSSLVNYGSNYGVRFSADPGGYTNNNNNEFFGVCWQSGSGDGAANTFVAGATVLAGAYVTSQGEEYVALGAQGASFTLGVAAPTHTSGDVANGTASLRYIGPYRSAPMLCDYAGGGNHIRGGRYESGYGSPIIARVNATNKIAATESSADLGYFGDNTIPPNPAGGVYADIEVQANPPRIDVACAGTSWVKHSTLGEERLTAGISNLNNRMIVGANGVYIPGMPLARIYSAWGGFAPSRACDMRHTKFGVWFGGQSDAPSLLIPVSAAASTFKFSWSAPDRTVGPSCSVLAFDASLAHIPASAGVYPVLGPYGFVQDSKLTDTSLKYDQYGVRVNNASVRFVCLALRNGYVNDVRVTVIPQVVHRLQPIGAIIDDRYGKIDGPRYTNGAVVSGLFPSAGERIFDLSSSTVYRVTTAGGVHPAWAASAVVVEGEYRSNAGKIYSADSAFASGTTAPTHTTGSVSDGVGNWTYAGPQAVIA